MRVFVTGSTGLLGNNLVRELLARGHEVVALTRSRAKFDRLLGDTPARPVVGDVLAVQDFAGELAGIDAVFHTAAYFRESYGLGDHTATLQATNVDATLALMAEADRRGVGVFVHTSSSGTIGKRPDGEPGNEDTPPSPRLQRNPYVRSKLLGDAAIHAWTPHHGMRIVEILPGWMFGPGDAGPTPAGQLVLDLAQGNIPAVPRGGSTVVDARDVAHAMVEALRAPHRSRYAVAGHPMTLREVADAVSAAAGRAAPRFDVPAWLAQRVARVTEIFAHLRGRQATVSAEGVRFMAEHLYIDSSRARAELGATFRPFSETARDVLAWYRAHGMLPEGRAAAITAGDVSSSRSPA